MSISCPSCGHNDFDPEGQCECGYQEIEPVIIGPASMEPEEKEISEIKGKKLTAMGKTGKNKQAEETVIKELDSWLFTFSEADNSLHIGTPALQSFKLKLPLKDLEEILESIYSRTGNGKTIRKLHISAEEMTDFVNAVHKMIEAKKSKISIKFDSKDMQELTDVMNLKMKA